MHEDRNGWHIEPLSNFVKDLADGATPDRSVQSNFGGDIPWVVITDLKRLIEQTDENLSRQGLSRCAAKLWPKETVILSTGATIGKVGIAKVPVATKQGITGLIPNDRITSRFLYYKLLSKKQKLNAWAQGSTFSEIRTPILRKLPLEIPRDLSVQKKISDVLEYADLAIEKTEALIDKYQQVKTGLMQDLFTCGIDSNGQLRPPRERAPELYKETPIGWIPKEWETFCLGDIGEFTNGLNKPKEAFGTGTKFINISDLYPDYLNTEDLDRVQTTEAENSAYEALEGDIFIDRSSVKLEGVGYPTVFESCAEPVVFSGFIIRFRPKSKDRMVPRFLCLQMRSPWFRAQVLKIATKSANINVNQASLSKLIVALPSFSEQERFVKRENTINRKLDAESLILEKLKKQKSGLMHDLLTGKVSVPLEHEAEPEVVHV